MASQTPPQPAAPPPQSPQPQADHYNNTNPYIHNVALGVTPIALIALFLPPRRLDLRFLILGGVTVWGTNQLVHDYTGTSTLNRFGRRVGLLFGAELPEKAKETQLRIRLERAERARKLREAQEAQGVRGVGEVGVSEERRRMVEEQERQRQGGKEEEERGLLKRVWMGDSPDDWKEKRDQREKEALSEGGGGYWGLIVDQVSEVWSGGKKKDDGKKTTENEKGNAEGESKKP
ncbi:hypothetical protein F4805DRAFT_410409 [Annulohypoxylon moriforme]|nr:hypothetical protein F4805DRAFT_410409 [Annulohypoxylon moriforme]